MQTGNDHHGTQTEYGNYQRAGRKDAEPIIRENTHSYRLFALKNLGETEMKKLNDFSANTRLKLAGLWTTLMLLYIYCDIYSTFRPGHLEEIMAGKMGPFDISQGTLAVLGALMIPAALMVSVSLFAGANVVKHASIIVGVVYTVVNVGNLIGETWAYYWIYGVLELALTIVIVVFAARWPKEEVSGNE